MPQIKEKVEQDMRDWGLEHEVELGLAPLRRDNTV